MKPQQLKTTLTKCIRTGLPVLIKGAPGIGKSNIVEQVADELDMDLVIFHPVVSDPTDFKGLPSIIKEEAEFLPFGDLRKLINAKRPTIAFMDDIGQAPAVVQAALMQLILARQVNGKKISDNVVFIAATNRREDRAGVTGILEPVKSRFATIIQLEVDPEQWVEWALKNEVPAELIGFVYFRPRLLSTGEATADIVNHPCPRTMAYAGKLINAGLTDIETLAGAIGEGAAVELIGFLKTCKSLPSIASILLDPEKAMVPTEPAALYAVTSALIDKADETNADRIFKYANRMPADFSVLLVRDVIRKNEKIQNCKAFIAWVSAHKDVFVA